MSDPGRRYLRRPMTPPDPAVLRAIEAGPLDPGEALALSEMDRLLDPAPLPGETGWCTLPDGAATSRCARRCRE